MQIKEFVAEYTYDTNLDVVNIEVKKEYVHQKSIEFHSLKTSRKCKKNMSFEKNV